jgi:pilus assembly protein Flp/PilA
MRQFAADRGGRRLDEESYKEANMNIIKKFLASEDGPTAVEYAVVLVLIIVVCIGTIANIGTKINASYNASTAKLP